MVNVHDKARELAEALMQSEEYRSYIEMKERASGNEELSAAINDLHEKQFEMQKRQINGEEIGPEYIGQMQNLSQILMRDPLAAEYLQAEIRFTLMVNDVYEIIGEAVKTSN
ncbi:MAG: YlbF family regulator [Clostridiales Family XIII bacterium]|jgi:cell fate (sporulation/competence/biofilm development) regulator YlbF (YheA/YmcA/DUF963 family)|nr:YlbF family regulator [Clostridiales Family XIII bacterium]